MKTNKHAYLVISCSLLTIPASIVYAQESLVGTYTGDFQAANSSKTNGVRLVIDSVENGTVKGTATRFQKGACNGDYPMEGELNGSSLIMRESKKGGRTEECSFGINVTQEGNKLVGTTHRGQPIQLAK